MKIKFFIRDLKIEGVQVVTIRLAKILAEHGHQVEILTLYSAKDLALPHNVSLTSLHANAHAKKIKKEYNLVFDHWYQKNQDFDWLIASHGETSKVVAHYKDPRFVQYIHNSDEYTYGKKSLINKYRYCYKQRRLLRNKHVLCVSDGITNFMRGVASSQALSIHTLYNPFDIVDIKEKAQEAISPIAENYIIFVGRLSSQKRVDRLLESFHKVKDKDLKLIIMGEGELENDLKEITLKLKLEGRVIFHKFTQNPFPHIAKAKALVLTSDHEGFGNVIIESIICHTRVVSIDCPSGPNEILIDKFEQGLVASYKPEDIAKCIDKTLQFNGYQQHDYESIVSRFSEQVIYERFIKLLVSFSVTSS